MNMDWINNFEGPILTIFYEDLCENVELEIMRMLNFLDVTVSQRTIECVLARKDGVYKRVKKKSQDDVFGPNMIKFLEERKLVVYNTLKLSNAQLIKLGSLFNNSMDTNY